MGASSQIAPPRARPALHLQSSTLHRRLLWHALTLSGVSQRREMQASLACAAHRIIRDSSNRLMRPQLPIVAAHIWPSQTPITPLMRKRYSPFNLWLHLRNEIPWNKLQLSVSSQLSWGRGSEILMRTLSWSKQDLIMLITILFQAHWKPQTWVLCHLRPSWRRGSSSRVLYFPPKNCLAISARSTKVSLFLRFQPLKAV